VFGRGTSGLRTAVAGTTDRTERVAALTRFLLAVPHQPDELSQQIASLVEEIATRPDITRVAQVAALAGVTIRQLQRRFTEYVGAGPKWVIIRCRLQEAAARAALGTDQDWAALAYELGFADQAHLTRAFSETIGTPPAAYAQEVQSGG
jgi:transcriptional regulator GlxA family with amidase domain